MLHYQVEFVAITKISFLVHISGGTQLRALIQKVFFICEGQCVRQVHYQNVLCKEMCYAASTLCAGFSFNLFWPKIQHNPICLFELSSTSGKNEQENKKKCFEIFIGFVTATHQALLKAARQEIILSDTDLKVLVKTLFLSISMCDAKNVEIKWPIFHSFFNFICEKILLIGLNLNAFSEEASYNSSFVMVSNIPFPSMKTVKLRIKAKIQRGTGKMVLVCMHLRISIHQGNSTKGPIYTREFH